MAWNVAEPRLELRRRLAVLNLITWWLVGLELQLKPIVVGQ